MDRLPTEVIRIVFGFLSAGEDDTRQAVQNEIALSETCKSFSALYRGDPNLQIKRLSERKRCRSEVDSYFSAVFFDGPQTPVNSAPGVEESATAHWTNHDFERYHLLAESHMFWAAMSPNILHRICHQSFYLTVELERANRMRQKRQSLSAAVRSPLDIEWARWHDDTQFIFLGSIWWTHEEIMTGIADGDDFWLMLSFPHSGQTTLYSWCKGEERKQSAVTQFIAKNQHRAARIGGVMSIRSNS